MRARRTFLLLGLLTACRGNASTDSADDTTPPATSPTTTAPTAPPGDAPPASLPRPTLVETNATATIASGDVSIVFDKHTGRFDATFGAITALKGAYASVDLGDGGYLTSTAYATHAVASSAPLDDAEGTGLRVIFASTAAGKPTIEQHVTIYAGERSFTVEEHVVAASPIASRWMGALIVDDQGSVTAGDGPDPRVLDVPFDNDEWVRYDSRVLGGADFSGTSYEVAAVYESASRRGLVVGSVTHDFWKTGIYYEGTKGRLRKMNVYGGAATPDASSSAGPTYGKDGTHDVAKHGLASGTTLVSPRVFVGFSGDWRDGLEAFGKANARVHPPRAWSGAAPFGWMSWGAYGLGVTSDRLLAVSDFLKSSLGTFGAGGPLYVNIDAGLSGDPKPVVDHVHANGQRVGTYRVPFSYFAADAAASLAKPVGAGTTYTYGDIVLRDDAGNPIRHNGAYALDVTHPGTRASMKAQIDSVVAGGFDFLKLDFMTNGALEGKHFDPAVKTGMQAYDQAMAYLASLIPPNVFVSLSIAPLFPSGYAHSRRISCDVVGQLDDVQSPAYPHYGSIEYMLESLTYGWWAAGTLYPYVDPDAMALARFEGKGAVVPEEWSRTHVTAAAIAGAPFLDSTDYTDATGAARSTTYLANPALNELARRGVPFRPLDGATGRVDAPISGSTSTNSGSSASDVFVRTDGAVTYVAVFDFDPNAATTKAIDLARAGLDAKKTYAVTELWSGAKSSASGTLTIDLASGQAKIVALEAP